MSKQNRGHLNSQMPFYKKVSGFSLLELLFAVAIIGILASIGIVNYSKTQARTRQSEAKASLSTIFVAEQSFLGEWNQYSVDLRNLGFGVFGTRLRYMTGYYGGVPCAGYDTTKGAPAENSAVSNTWSCGTNVNNLTVDHAVNWKLPLNVTIVADQCTANPAPLAGTASSCDATIGSQSFTAISIGDPSRDPGPEPIDGWSITHRKFFSNTTSGLQ